MRSFLNLAVAIATLTSTVAAGSAVDGISFTDMTNSGTYSAVSSYTNGQCSTADQTFSGAFAPMNEEVTVIIRGPIQLKQFAVYSGSSGSSKHKRSDHHHARGHREFHKRNQAIREVQEKRAVGDEVVVTVNGVVESWINSYSGGAATSAPAAAPPAATTAPADTPAPAVTSAAAPSSAAQSSAAPSAPAASGSSGSSSGSYSSGSWTRQAFYSSSSASASGLTFLANPSFSALLTTLSSATTALKSLVTGSNVLSDSLVPSNSEFMIWTDTKCNGDCPYTLDNSLAYHGFDTSKDIAFFFEFQMPEDHTPGDNENLPAIWLLNSRIPRVGQYDSCTCWQADTSGKPGCGEIDLWEANPTNGPDQLLPMFHCMGSKSGGSLNSDYFDRPYDNTLTTAAVFCHSTQTFQMASVNSTDLSAVDGSIIDGICNQQANGRSFSSF